MQKLNKNGEWDFNPKNRILNFCIKGDLHSSFRFLSETSGDFKFSTETDKKEIQVKLKEVVFKRLKEKI